MNIRLLVSLLLYLWGGTVWAATCNASASPQMPKPSWADLAVVEGDDKFYGIGIADIVGNDISRALAEARSKANAELAQSIRVTVSSTIKTSESKLTENGKTATRSSFDAVSDSVANISLQSVAVDGQWVDGSECRLWLRLSLSRQEAQRAQKLEIAKGMATAFEAQMAIVEGLTGSAPQRERALVTSGEILELIDPVYLPTFSVEAARVRLNASRSLVSDARRLFTQYGDQLALHLGLFGQMTSATSAGPKRAAATSAMTALQSMLGLAPAGMPGLPLPFNVEQRMTALFIELNIPCSAGKWFVEHGKPVPPQFAGVTPNCAAADLSRERRQMYLAGRSVHITCVIKLDGQSRPWEKVCASMQEKLLRDGAIVTTSPTQAKGGDHSLKVSATGAMKKRIDLETQTTFYRFEGVIATAFNGPNQVDISDQYEGITGWNPVSASMTTDVLALNVASRLDAAISKHWEK